MNQKKKNAKVRGGEGNVPSRITWLYVNHKTSLPFIASLHLLELLFDLFHCASMIFIFYLIVTHCTHSVPSVEIVLELCQLAVPVAASQVKQVNSTCIQMCLLVRCSGNEFCSELTGIVWKKPM